MAQDLTSSTCIGAAGEGVKTTWLLEGQATAYTNATGVSVDTDGYKITAAMTWRTTANTGTTIALSVETGLTAHADTGTAVVIGACAETLTSASAALAAKTTDAGNYALCHWLFFHWGGNNAHVTTASTGSNAWGESKYLNEAAWGTAGDAVTGAGTHASSGGTSLTSATNGLTLTPTPAATLALGNGTEYTMWWYQPKFATTYAATALRRYNGGKSDADKVKGYCASQRKADGAAHKSGGWKAGATVTLAGAAALAVSAVALGAAAIAI